MADAAGMVAMFISGYGVIPKSVFSDKERYEGTGKFFDNLPFLHNDYLLPDNHKIVVGKTDNIFLEVKAAKKGMFVFDNEEYTDNYNLISVPKRKLVVNNLPQQIQEQLKWLTFENIKFEETKRISITQHFACE